MTRAGQPGALQLKTLGRLDLTMPDGESLDDVLSRPKELALVVYLAMTSALGTYVRRDTLLLLFWPDLDEPHARHALRQMLYSLRHGLGPEVIQSRGAQEVGIAPAQLICDATLLRAAAEAGAWERVADLYTGEFLTGFNPGGVAPELEHWIDDTRAEIRRTARKAVRSLAESAESRDELAAAIRWAGAAVEIDPLSEPDVQRLVRLHGRDGSVPLAVEAYERYRTRLGADLDLQPGEVLRIEVESLRARGRPASPGRTDPTPPAARIDDPSEPDRTVADAGRERRWRPRVALWSTGMVLLVVWVVAGIPLPGGHRPVPPAPSTVRLAIVPLQTGSDRDGESAAIAYAAAWALSDVDGLNVADPGTVRAVLQRAGGESPLDPVEAVRRVLGSDLVLTTRPIPGRPDRALVELREGPSRRTPSRRVSVPSGIEEVGAATLGVVELLRGSGAIAGLEGEAGPAVILPRGEALAAYILADEYLYQGEARAAERELRRVVSLDPDFALGWHRLSVAAGMVFDGPMADSAAERAGRLSPGAPRRLALLIEARRAYRKGAPDEAETALRNLLSQYPDDIEAQYQLGEVLVHYNPIRGRSATEALPFLRGSAALGIARAEALYHTAQLSLLTGDTTTMRRAGAQLLSLSAATYRAPQVRILLAHVSGDPVAWRRELGRLRSADSYTILSAAHTLAVHGRSPAAASEVARLLTESDQPSDLRALGYRVLGDLALARGRPSEAWTHYDRAAQDAPRTALLHQAFMAALPSIPVDSARLAELDRRIAALDGPGDARTSWFFVEPSLDPELPAYLAALLALKRGDPDATLRLLRSLASDPVGSRSGARLRADLSQRYRLTTNSPTGPEADPTAGVRVQIEQTVLSPLYSTPDLRYLYALRVAATGRPRLALRLLGSLEENSIADLALAGPARLAAARIHEQLGEPQKAARLYESLLSLWEDAESVYAPMVERARDGAAAPPALAHGG